MLVLTSHPEFEKFFGRRVDRKRKLYNGMLKCDLYFFQRGRERRGFKQREARGMFGLFKKKKNEEELYLEDLERRRREAQAPDDTGFQMTVEDVFAISGRGTVVTGRISRGRISQGDRVLIRKRQGTVQEARIGGIEAFRRPLRTAEAGQAVGLLLREIRREQVEPGDVLTGS